MLDTPLVRGEREELAEEGGVRLDMVRNKDSGGVQGQTQNDRYFLFKSSRVG